MGVIFDAQREIHLGKTKWRKNKIALSEAFSVFIIGKIVSEVQELGRHFVLAYI